MLTHRVSVSMSVRIKFSFLPPFLRFFVSSRSSVSSILSCSRNAATINRRSRDILIRDTQRGFVSSALDRRHSFAVRPGKFSFEPRGVRQLRELRDYATEDREERAKLSHGFSIFGSFPRFNVEKKVSRVLLRSWSRHSAGMQHLVVNRYRG